MAFPKLPSVPNLTGTAGGYYNIDDPAAFGYLLNQFQEQPAGFVRWLQGQFPKYRAMWQAEQPFNQRGFYDFLAPEMVRSDFAVADPFERGERPNLFAPRARFINF